MGEVDRVGVVGVYCGEVHEEPFKWWLTGFDWRRHGQRSGDPLAMAAHLDGAATDAPPHAGVKGRPSQFDPAVDVDLTLESWHHFSS